MKVNNLTIIPPEGMEAYQEGNEIKFRKKFSLENVYKELFFNKTIYYMNDMGWACKRKDDFDSMIPFDNRTIENNCTSEKQIEKLLAIIKLMNVAKYLNGDWKSDWNDRDQMKYYINHISTIGKLTISKTCTNNYAFIYFKSQELAQQAIDIIGEETIKLALSTDW